MGGGMKVWEMRLRVPDKSCVVIDWMIRAGFLRITIFQGTVLVFKRAFAFPGLVGRFGV